MTALKDFSQAAARRYLQTAVFVDDEIFDKTSGKPLDLPDGPKPRKRVYVSGELLQTIEEKQEEIGASYHPKELVSSFAQEGIICALYEPQPDFPTEPGSEIFKLCEQTDIIILDWDFSEDRGEKALNLISALVRQSHEEIPNHTRLLSIYTTDPSLEGVANQIGDRLHKDGFSVDPVRSPCRLQSGATRLVVFGKEGKRFGKDEEEFTVKDADLPVRLIGEFVEMNAGVLPSYALHGMGAIRRNSKRVLDRFHRGMDGAFLLHRLLIARSEEAFDQLPELLADELRAIVEDEHLEASQAERISLSAVDGNAVSQQDADAIAYAKGGAGPSRVINKKVLAADKQSVPLDHQLLAALFSNRTQYSRTFRRLTYGTVVRRRVTKDSPWEFGFCLNPVCDSLRLDVEKNVRFPFWKLPEDLYAGTTKRRGMVVLLPDGKPIGLTAGGKASDMLWLEEFKVDATTQTVRATLKDGAFKFEGPKYDIEWIGQLKPLHAQRIATDISESLSRVGLDEAEWVRLLCDR
ncbi:MAG: hypothetical protein QOG23_4157 [Blastocatellia bacterium]|jgi:hypothetical protein|nr:hypothetical protein [Blastocatellia bacterium]